MTLSKDKKVYTIILEIQIKKKIDEFAKKHDRSSSNLINHILKQFIGQELSKERREIDFGAE